MPSARDCIPRTASASSARRSRAAGCRGSAGRGRRRARAARWSTATPRRAASRRRSAAPPVKRGCTTMRSPVDRSSTTSLARRQAARRTRAREPRDELLRGDLAKNVGRRHAHGHDLRPTISRSRSRAIVSVSGSSGTPRRFGSLEKLNRASSRQPMSVRCCLPANVTLLAKPRLRSCASSNVCAEARDGEHAPARGDQIAVRGALGAGVKDEHVIRCSWDLDAVAGARLVGISGGRQHGGDGCAPVRDAVALRQRFSHRDAPNQLGE